MFEELDPDISTELLTQQVADKCHCQTDRVLTGMIREGRFQKVKS